MTKWEIENLLRPYNIPSGPGYTVPEAFESEQLNSRNMVVEVEDKQIGKIRMPGSPIKISGIDDVPAGSAPLLGEDTAPLLADIGYTEEQIAGLMEENIVMCEGGRKMRPLEGITVLDFTQAYSGPYCAMNLADYGARVIKVERIDTGDQSRFWNPYAANGNSGYFAVYNRNKEGIAVDMRAPEGKEIIKRLYGKVDVVLENFKFGTLDKLGLGYEEMKKINPEIIFGSITGFGQTGPLRANTAYDNVIECMSGFMEMTGFPEFPPLRSGASVADSYTGLTMALAITLACYDKKRTGKGRGSMLLCWIRCLRLSRMQCWHMRLQARK